MKFYMDIVVNHTADVIHFAECAGKSECPYRSIADYPYQRRGGVGGAPINPGFTGESDGCAANFAKLTDPELRLHRRASRRPRKDVKRPAWLNDPIYYHNRGNSTFRGESSTMGDFVGLDDVFTENPRVIRGMIDIYGAWIDKYGVDGFRIDTAQHVNPEFWQKFVPAMLARAQGARHSATSTSSAKSRWTTMDPAHTAVNTRVDKLPSVLDFAFLRAFVDVVAGRRRHRRAGQAVPRRPALRGRRRGRARAADLHRQPRCRAASRCFVRHAHAQAPATTSCCSATCSPTPCC